MTPCLSKKPASKSSKHDSPGWRKRLNPLTVSEMVYKIDYLEDVYEWSITETLATQPPDTVSYAFPPIVVVG
jgi:hypothetical protein